MNRTIASSSSGRRWFSDSTQPRSSRLTTLVALVYVASIPFDIVPVAGGIVPVAGARTATPVVGALLLVVWLIDQIPNPVKIDVPLPAVLLLWAYTLWAIFSMFWSIDQAQSVAGLPRILSHLPLTIILCSLLQKIWLKALAVLGASTTALAWIVLLQPADIHRAERANFNGIDENVTALVLSVGFAALLHVALKVRGIPVVVTIIAAMITAGAILHTGSRSGAIALAAVLATTIAQGVARSRPSPRLMVGSLLSLLLGFLTFAYLQKSGQVPERILQMANDSSGIADSGRGSILDLYLGTFDKWYLFGVGYDNDAVYLQRTTGQFWYAHSLLWKTWIELGIPGLAFLGGLGAFLVFHVKRSVEPGALLKMAGPILVFAYTLGGGETSAFWFVIAFGLARAPVHVGSIEAGQVRGSVQGRSKPEVVVMRSGD